jgi:hydrogenase 3 maturation protease
LKDSRQIPSETFISDIRKRVRGKPAVVGIGNIMRGDDGLGPKLIELLKTSRKAPQALFDCGTAPENYIFPILASGADTVIFVDACDFHSFPGDIRIFDLDEISDVSFSTHSPSPRLFTDLLKTGKENINMFIVSVQPKTVKLGASLSPEVTSALGLLADMLVKALA